MSPPPRRVNRGQQAARLATPADRDPSRERVAPDELHDHVGNLSVLRNVERVDVGVLGAVFPEPRNARYVAQSNRFPQAVHCATASV
jgi:hypothetical protein